MADQQAQQAQPALPPMQYMNLGKTGLKVSRICLGCMGFGSKKWQEWVVEEEQSLPVIKRAFDLGINFFDTADIYSSGESERILGKALKQFNIPREEVVIATKVFFPLVETLGAGANTNDVKYLNKKGLSRKHIFHAVEDSLKRLGTDYIDLYQIHRFDPETPVLETMQALHDLVKSGKVRYIGASSMYAHQFAMYQYTAQLHGLTLFSTMQNLYNMVYREEERDVIPLCNQFGVGLIPWSPLAGGILTDRDPQQSIRAQQKTVPSNEWYMSTEADKLILERTKELAKKKGVPTSQVATAWVLHKKTVVSPIIGASKISHLEDAVKAVHVKLDADEIKYLEEPYKAKPVYGWLSPPSI